MIGQFIGAGLGLGAGILSNIEQNRLARKQLAESDKLMAEYNAMREANPYKTPQEINNNLSDAKNSLNSPSLLYRLSLQQSDKSLANSVDNVKNFAGSGASALAYLSQVQANDNFNRGQSIEKAYADQNRKKEMLASARELSAGYSDKEFQQNILLPELQKLNWAQQDRAAGIRNQQSAWSNLAQLASGAGKLISSET